MHKHNLYKTELINSQVRTSVLIDFQKADLYVLVKLFDVVRIFLLNMSFEGILFLTMFLSRTPKISLSFVQTVLRSRANSVRLKSY